MMMLIWSGSSGKGGGNCREEWECSMVAKYELPQDAAVQVPCDPGSADSGQGFWYAFIISICSSGSKSCHLVQSIIRGLFAAA